MESHSPSLDQLSPPRGAYVFYDVSYPPIVHIERTWQQSQTLPIHQQHAVGQLMYMALCQRLERAFRDVLSIRIYEIQKQCDPNDRAPSMDWMTCQKEACRFDRLGLGTLYEEYRRHFKDECRSISGDVIHHNTISAIRKIRNVIGHGGWLWVMVPLDPLTGGDELTHEALTHMMVVCTKIPFLKKTQYSLLPPSPSAQLTSPFLFRKDTKNTNMSTKWVISSP